MAKPSKTSLAVPGEPSEWKTEAVNPSDLKVGDWFHLYGTEVARVTAVDSDKPEAGVVYEWKDRTYTGLKPVKAGEKVTRIRV